MSTILETARRELDTLEHEVLSPNDPFSIGEKAVHLSVLLSSVNVQVAAARQANARDYEKLLAEHSATAAKELAHALPSYLTYKAAEGISEALREAIYSLRKLAEIAAQEKQLIK